MTLVLETKVLEGPWVGEGWEACGQTPGGKLELRDSRSYDVTPRAD